MLELSPARKNKVHLSDYPFEQDIENRLLMADFSSFDLEVLEEILYSPLKISLKKLARNLGCEEELLLPILKKFSKGGLFSLHDDLLVVDKEMRKYFEFQITRFAPDFKPDMEFIQGILKKVPIHVLPNWYSIPRTSNNIFESIVEKYLLTPHIYQRHLLELNFGDPILNGIVQDVLHAPDLKIPSRDLLAKYHLEPRDLAEILLFLEFHFVCCVSYEKEESRWVEWVTSFQEWRDYTSFLRKTEAPEIAPGEPILRTREKDFAFVEEMTTLLMALKKKPLSLYSWQEGSPLSSPLVREISSLCHFPFSEPKALVHLLQKLLAVQLVERVEGRLYALEAAENWLDMSLENRALFLYRHPANRILSVSLPPHLATERSVREAEKAIRRALHGKWVFFDDFLKGVLVSLSDEPALALKKAGKHWKYTLPAYKEEEKTLIKAAIFEILFEAGMVATGTCRGRECFSVTPFGCFFFEE